MVGNGERAWVFGPFFMFGATMTHNTMFGTVRLSEPMMNKLQVKMTSEVGDTYRNLPIPTH